MPALTDYLETALLNHVFRSEAYVPPTTIYLALLTSTPDDSGAGTEMTGGSYARQAITFSPAVSPDGRITNNVSAVFTNLPGADVVAGAFYDDISAGNMLMYSVLPAPRSVVAGDNLTVAIGDLNVYLS